MIKKDETSKDLVSTLAALRKQFGDGAIMQGNIVVKGVKGLPTGALTLDTALGVGGVPCGRITEIFGPESSGKTTVCLEVIAGVQRNGGTAAFIDVEHALDTIYAQNLGVDLDKLLLSQPDSGEEALIICESLAKTGEIQVIVVDSIAALATKAELEGDIGDHNVGAQARLISQALKKLSNVAHKSGTAILFTNQLREKIGVMFGSNEVTPGGRAMKFYASVRMDIRKIEGIKKGDEDPTGNRVRVKVVKNKVASPFKKAEFDITFGKGIDKVGCILDEAERINLIKKAGSMFKYDNKSYNGRAKLREYVESNPEIVKALDMELRNQLKLNPIIEVEKELEAPEDVITIEKD